MRILASLFLAAALGSCQPSGLCAGRQCARTSDCLADDVCVELRCQTPCTTNSDCGSSWCEPFDASSYCVRECQ